MPQTHIADLLAFVNQETKFFNAFKHAKNRGKLASSDFDPLVACIIANATRYGIFKMADICNFNHDKLRIVQANLLRMETLRAANDRVSDAVLLPYGNATQEPCICNLECHGHAWPMGLGNRAVPPCPSEAL